MQDPFYDENVSPELKQRRNKLSDDELNELRDYIDTVSFNLGKAYQHAKDRSRKQSQRNSMRRRFHHTYKNEK